MSNLQNMKDLVKSLNPQFEFELKTSDVSHFIDLIAQPKYKYQVIISNCILLIMLIE